MCIEKAGFFSIQRETKLEVKSCQNVITELAFWVGLC